MKYIVYLTTNIKSSINGQNRIYIGVHQTENPDIFDGYIGCGIYINQPSTYMYPKTPFQYAVKKYGVSAFKRTTLYIYDTKEEAYLKESELVDTDFLKLPYTYNACLGGISYNNYKPLFQFDLEGNLQKRWDYSVEAYEFYNIPMEKFEYAIHDKHPLVDSIWSTSETIDITEYTTTPWGSPKVTHLYSKEGKWLKEFISRQECAEFIGVNEAAIVKAIQHQRLVKKQYYVSDTMVDEFIPKARKQLINQTFYVYNEDGTFIGTYVGKEVMPIIGILSWSTFGDCMRYKQGWHKNFYISEEEISELPQRPNRNGVKVDVYDKYGNFIETLSTVKEVREKYNVPAAKIKNIQLGDRYYKDKIFKYHSK